MAMAGKGLRILVANVAEPTDTDFAEVADLNDATMSSEADNQDISTFSSEYVRRLQGLKDNTFSLGGFYNATDADGQMAIRSAWADDTPLHVRFLPDGTTGFQQEVKVASFEVSASADGVVELSIDLDGHDAVTLV